ncbi:MAG: long-chain fatty acid--CoA ligase [Acidimicrobiales bacterium]|nr:long-chain fatty acid--CoA ligase [Acidimicrobiales bacterium]
MNFGERFDLARGKDLTLGVLMDRLAAIHGNGRMVEEAESGRVRTFAEVAAQVDRWAGAIHARTEPGDRVVLTTGNVYDQFLLVLAASRAGRLPAPVNSQMAQAEIDHVVQDSGASLVVSDTSDLEGGPPLGRAEPADPRDVGALFYTSGTTGKPKGAQLTHRGLFGGMPLTSVAPRRMTRDEIVMGLPVAHIFGFTIAIGAACGGLPIYFMKKFNPVKVLDAIETRRATVFAGVPAMYRMLMEAGADERDLKSVRLWISGADAMPQDLAMEFKKLGASLRVPFFGSVGEAMFAEGYGMVETGGGVALRISPPLVPGALGGSMGLPLPGNKFKVVDEDGNEVPVGGVGELLLQGHSILKGYHGAPDATAAALTDDGWLRTGDMARRGPFGAVNFEGRMKDVIKRGGYSVYAVEVEQDLEEHDDVVEAAVVAYPDARDGEVPVAAVRLQQGATFDAEALRAFAEGRMSRYKVPAHFVEVDDFPRSGTDKIQRKKVAEIVQGLIDA